MPPITDVEACKNIPEAAALLQASSCPERAHTTLATEWWQALKNEDWEIVNRLSVFMESGDVREEGESRTEYLLRLLHLSDARMCASSLAQKIPEHATTSPLPRRCRM